MAMVRKHPTYPQYRMKVGSMPDFSGSESMPGEEPIGAIDGVNKVFTTTKLPIKNSETVYKDGMYMARNLDYTIDYATGTIVFSDDQIPRPANELGNKSVIRVVYKYMKTI